MSIQSYLPLDGPRAAKTALRTLQFFFLISVIRILKISRELFIYLFYREVMFYSRSSICVHNETQVSGIHV